MFDPAIFPGFPASQADGRHRSRSVYWQAAAAASQYRPGSMKDHPDGAPAPCRQGAHPDWRAFQQGPARAAHGLPARLCGSLAGGPDPIAAALRAHPPHSARWPHLPPFGAAPIHPVHADYGSGMDARMGSQGSGSGGAGWRSRVQSCAIADDPPDRTDAPRWPAMSLHRMADRSLSPQIHHRYGTARPGPRSVRILLVSAGDGAAHRTSSVRRTRPGRHQGSAPCRSHQLQQCSRLRRTGRAQLANSACAGSARPSQSPLPPSGAAAIRQSHRPHPR